MPLVLTGCVQCEYPRSGLAPDAPCPECGAAHDADTFLVRGWSAPGTGLTTMVIGLLLLAGAVVLGVVQPRSFECLVAVGGLLGVLVAGTGFMQRLQVGQGGDVVWAFRPTGIEVRVRGVRTPIPWRLLDVLRTQRRWRRWERVQARSTALFLGGHPVIWLRDGDELVARMVDVAQRRIGGGA